MAGTADREPQTTGRAGNIAERVPVATKVQPLDRVGQSEIAPWTNSLFWILQLVILALYLIRLAATVAVPPRWSGLAGTRVLDLGPLSGAGRLCATLNFGLEGALFTVRLGHPSGGSAIPLRGWQSQLPGAAWAELAQVGVLDALALLVGQRVTAERNARRIAESAQEAHLSAEALLSRSVLFEPGTDPHRRRQWLRHRDERLRSASILDPERKADNERRTGTLPHRGLPIRLVDMIGPVASGHMLTGRLISEQLPGLRQDERSLRGRPDRVELITVRDRTGNRSCIRPTATILRRSDDGTRMQIVFEDVTAETRRRHDLMEAYAASRGARAKRRSAATLPRRSTTARCRRSSTLCRQIDTLSSRADMP